MMVLGESCEGTSDVYCNGPLEPSTTYYMALRAFTEDGKFTDAPFSDPIKTSMCSFNAQENYVHLYIFWS